MCIVADENNSMLVVNVEIYKKLVNNSIREKVIIVIKVLRILGLAIAILGILAGFSAIAESMESTYMTTQANGVMYIIVSVVTGLFLNWMAEVLENLQKQTKLINIQTEILKEVNELEVDEVEVSNN